MPCTQIITIDEDPGNGIKTFGSLTIPTVHFWPSLYSTRDFVISHTCKLKYQKCKNTRSLWSDKSRHVMNIAYSYIWQWHLRMESVIMFTFHVNNATLHYILSSCILFPAISCLFYPTTTIIHRFEHITPTVTCMHYHPHLSAIPPLSVLYVTMPCTPYIIYY